LPLYNCRKKTPHIPIGWRRKDAMTVKARFDPRQRGQLWHWDEDIADFANA
tara:strand:+ start:98 stop:250 length:153 start_codon:yes stop_codon:yes gene_type:complete